MNFWDLDWAINELGECAVSKQKSTSINTCTEKVHTRPQPYKLHAAFSHTFC